MNAFDNQCCEVDALMKALLYAINVCEIHTLFSAPPVRTQIRTSRAQTRQTPTARPRAKKDTHTALGSQPRPLARSPWLAALGSQPRPLPRKPWLSVAARPTQLVSKKIGEAVGSTVISAIPLLPRLDEHLSGILQERILIDLFASQRRRRH